MGADMLVAMARMPHYDDGKESYENVPEDIALITATARARQVGQEMSVSNLAEALERYGFEIGDGDETDEIWKEQAIQTLQVEVRKAVHRLYADPRDVAQIHVMSTWWWMTGGLSWGDSPTDSFDDVSLLTEFSIFDEAIEKVTERQEPDGDES